MTRTFELPEQPDDTMTEIGPYRANIDYEFFGDKKEALGVVLSPEHTNEMFVAWLDSPEDKDSSVTIIPLSSLHRIVQYKENNE